MDLTLYDSLRQGSIVFGCCIAKEQLDEFNQIEPEFDTIWDEELSITSSRDIEDMTYEDPVERDMIIPSPYDANDEEWLNPFVTLVEEEAPPDIKGSFHMQLVHYDGEFENLRPHIFGDASMISSSYLSNTMDKEACYTEDSLGKIQPMVSPNYYSVVFLEKH